LGPAQPSSTIARCLNGGYGWLEVKCHRCETKAVPLDAIRRPRNTPMAMATVDIVTNGNNSATVRRCLLLMARTPGQPWSVGAPLAGENVSPARRAFQVKQVRTMFCGEEQFGSGR